MELGGQTHRNLTDGDVTLNTKFAHVKHLTVEHPSEDKVIGSLLGALSNDKKRCVVLL